MTRDATPARCGLPEGLETLVLRLLALGPMHGYDLAQRIRRVSSDGLVEEGILYPVLQRMLVDGRVTAQWRPCDGARRARFYALTSAGRRHLRVISRPHAAPVRNRRVAPGLLAVVGMVPLTAGCAASMSAMSVRTTDPDRALAFFTARLGGDVARDLAALRPPPAHPATIRRALAALPRSGAVRPSTAEAKSLAALASILRFHQREQVIVTRVIDVPQAAVALHGRAVLLITRPALALLSIPELQAAVAHEMGHDFFWDEHLRLQERPDIRSRRQMELRCDGIAVATLRALDLPRAPLLSAVRKLTRFNERLSPAVGAEFYPSLEDRAAFIRALDQHVDTVVSTRGQRPH